MWLAYIHVRVLRVLWPTLGSRTAKEQNRIARTGIAYLFDQLSRLRCLLAREVLMSPPVDRPTRNLRNSVLSSSFRQSSHRSLFCYVIRNVQSLSLSLYCESRTLSKHSSAQRMKSRTEFAPRSPDCRS